MSAIETRKAQARDRIVLLGKAIKQLEHQRQLDAQAFMMRETMAFVEPLTKALDDGAAKLALPPHVPDKPVKLEPDVVKPKQIFKWFGNPKEGGSRWNQRALTMSAVPNGVERFAVSLRFEGVAFAGLLARKKPETNRTTANRNPVATRCACA